MIKIELFDPKTEETKVYKQAYVSSRKLRDAFKVQSEIEGNELSQVDQLDLMLEYVESLFDDENVTTETILDGVPSDQLMIIIPEIMNEVVGNDPKKVEPPKE